LINVWYFRQNGSDKLVFQAALVSELRTEMTALENLLATERIRIEKMVFEMAQKDGKILEQQVTIQMMSKRVSSNERLIMQSHFYLDNCGATYRTLTCCSDFIPGFSL